MQWMSRGWAAETTMHRDIVWQGYWYKALGSLEQHGAEQTTGCWRDKMLLLFLVRHGSRCRNMHWLTKYGCLDCTNGFVT